jgi:hypothetical protein
MLLAATLLSFYSQFGDRYKEARTGFPEQYVLQAFATIPLDSVVIARWNEFTTLNYMQVVKQMRPDLKIILPAIDKRGYEFGEIDDYLSYVDGAICDSPVVTNKLTDELIDQYDYFPIGEEVWWYQLHPKSPCN